MTARTQLLTDAFAALDRGDVSAFEDLFRPDAKWRGVNAMGYNGETPL
jgi:ketosteroid isomerase-like protein